MPLAQFSFLDKLVDDAPLQGLLRRKRRAGKNGFQRILDADQPWQALGAAGAGNDPELDLGQAESRRGHRHPIVAHEGHFEPAAQSRAMDRSDDRFAPAFDRGLAVGEWSAFRRLAEFGDIGPGDKGAAGADHYDGLDGGVGHGLPDAVAEPGADVRRQGVDRR